MSPDLLLGVDGGDQGNEGYEGSELEHRVSEELRYEGAFTEELQHNSDPSLLSLRDCPPGSPHIMDIVADIRNAFGEKVPETLQA